MKYIYRILSIIFAQFIRFAKNLSLIQTNKRIFRRNNVKFIRRIKLTLLWIRILKIMITETITVMAVKSGYVRTRMKIYVGSKKNNFFLQFFKAINFKNKVPALCYTACNFSLFSFLDERHFVYPSFSKNLFFFLKECFGFSMFCIHVTTTGI